MFKQSQSHNFIKIIQLKMSQSRGFTSDLNLISNRAQEIPKLLAKFVDPEQLRQDKLMKAKEKYHQLLEKIEFNDCELPNNKRVYKYSHDQCLPYIHFFKLLARKPVEKESLINRLKIWIPDTIVLNDGEAPITWYYSNAQGYVFRTDTFTSRNVISKLTNYTSPDELVAVIKKQHYRNMEVAGNDTKLVCCREMSSTIGSLFANKSELVVIQKFVKSNGPKAFICRTVWRKEGNPYCWIITNKNDFYKEDNKPEITKYITNPRNMGSCTIVNTCRGKYLEETVPYIKNILTFLHIHLGITFKEFICDFIKDESGIWWMINVKGFIFDQCPNPLNLKPITHYGDELVEDENLLEQRKLMPPKVKAMNMELCTKVKMCKYCEQLYPETELQHKMTLKMIIQTDKHLYWRGKEFSWISRSDVTNLDVSNLYQEHKVCKQCYLLFTETEKLIELEGYFNKLLGVPVTEDTQYQKLTLLANQINNEPLKPTDGFSSDQEEKQVFDISATKQLILQSDNVPTIHNTTIKTLNRFRFMVLVHSVRDIPQNVDMSRNYYIEYTLFEQKNRIKLDFTGAQLYEKGYYINVNRMRLLYFFSLNRKGVSEYISHMRVLTMHLYQDQRKIGTMDLELQDFLSERVIRREFMKVFSGKELVPILSWGVNLTLGLVDSGSANVTRIKLKDHYGLYLPSSDFHTCEPLPTEWMTILVQKKDVTHEQQARDTMQYTQSFTALKRETVLSQNQMTQSMPKIYDASKFQKDSLCDSTRVMESQVQLLKELKDYELDEDEERKKKRKKNRRARPIDDF